MRLLLTGSNGFLGRNLINGLRESFSIITLSRKKADICIDLSLEVPKIPSSVEYVIHAAGKAHIIPKTIEEKEDFFKVNVKGTENLLKGLKNVKLKTFVFISSVSVYGKDFGEKIDENFPLHGETPYAKSKIQVERLLISWCKLKNVKLLILRLPLLAGTNPPGNLGDMIKAIKRKRYLSINSGKAKRSVVLAEDVAEWLLKEINNEGIYNLTDNYDPNFRQLEILISNQLNINLPFSIPLFVANIIGKTGDLFNLNFVNSLKIRKMTVNLTFSCKKAMKEVNWSPRKVIEYFKIN